MLNVFVIDPPSGHACVIVRDGAPDGPAARIAVWETAWLTVEMTLDCVAATEHLTDSVIQEVDEVV